MYRVLLPSGIRVGNNIKDDQSFHLITNGSFHEEESLWESDLYGHYVLSNESYGTEGTYFPTKNNGKISLRLNSLEETYIISKYFRSLGYKIKINIPNNLSNLEINKVFYSKNGISTNNYATIEAFEILVYIKSRRDYFRFRKDLCNLRKLNFYMRYWKGDYGIHGNGITIIN